MLNMQRESTCIQVSDLQTRHDALESFVLDLVNHGTRCDLNPTLEWQDEESLALGFLGYIKTMDEAIKHRAEEALNSSGL